MPLEFKKYESAEAGIFEDLGTVRSVAGKGGEIGFIPKNWNNTAKNVAIVITKKNGTSATVSASKPLSVALRAKEVSLGQLMKFQLTEAPNGTIFVSMPGGGAPIQKHAVDSIKDEDFEVEELSHEDTIAM